MADFDQNAKGGPPFKILKMADFFGRSSETSKNRKYWSDFGLIGMHGRGIYSSF